MENAADLGDDLLGAPGAGWGEHFARDAVRAATAGAGVELVFTSPAELDTYVDVMSRKPLPSSRALSRGFPMGPNSHWLSRLPKKAKSVKHRETAVKYLREIRGAFAAVAERSS